MFLEVTMLYRNNDLFPNETAVENNIFETIRQQKNISFLLASSQNIDRIVSAHRACKRAGKLLVIDMYTAWLRELPSLKLHAVGHVHGTFAAVE